MCYCKSNIVQKLTVGWVCKKLSASLTRRSFVWRVKLIEFQVRAEISHHLVFLIILTKSSWDLKTRENRISKSPRIITFHVSVYVRCFLVSFSYFSIFYFNSCFVFFLTPRYFAFWVSETKSRKLFVSCRLFLIHLSYHRYVLLTKRVAFVLTCDFDNSLTKEHSRKWIHGQFIE